MRVRDQAGEPVLNIEYKPYAESPATTMVEALRACTEERSHCSRAIAAARRSAAQNIRLLRNQTRIRAIQLAEQGVFRRFAESLFEIDHLRREAINTAINDCVALSLKIAREVIGEEATRPHTIASRISRELRSLSTRSSLEIALNPNEVQSTKAQFAALPSANRPSFTADPSIEAGNARISVPAGKIELNWEKHLAEIAKALSPSTEPVGGDSNSGEKNE